MTTLSEKQLEEIRVLAHPLADNGTAQALSVLDGEELAREVQGSLGETLSGEAGIQSARPWMIGRPTAAPKLADWIPASPARVSPSEP